MAQGQPQTLEAKLADLHRRIRRCKRCPLHRGRIKAVPGEGSPTARIMFIGEAPGRAEDEQGRPFVGRSGRFFDSLLAGIDLAREEAFITSSVKCRPPGNRAPRREELSTCKRNWLDRQIEWIDPAWLVLMGRVAIAQVLGETALLRSVHGQIRRQDGRAHLLTFHPAAAMRFAPIAAAMREDFDRLRRRLGREDRRKRRPC